MGRFPFRLTGGGYVLRPSPLRWTSVESASSAGANYRTAEVGRRAPARPPRSSHSSEATVRRGLLKLLHLCGKGASARGTTRGACVYSMETLGRAQT
jgi:hypothetical protein